MEAKMRVKVEDVMTREVASVKEHTPFKDIAETLIDRGVSAVPVVDEAGHVLGVVSEADLLHKEEFREQYYREGYRPPLKARLRHRLSRDGGHTEEKARGHTAAELMTAPAVTVPRHYSVVHASRLMENHGVKRLPVVDRDGVLTGVISRGDLLKVFVRSDHEIARQIRAEVLDKALWVETSRALVSVTDGVVTLHGRMTRRSDAAIAARMVQRINGVVEVVDELAWDEDDTATWNGR
jgi:CBS domain-containing protein